ncbi:MAG: thiamine phosphate synthase [Chloroflexota bacterium]|nr:thiamine phosphate synthase [Chloroflexota bacterium]
MLRLIDANLNRLSEGLRLLEDVARFMLNDAALSSRLKTLRHDTIAECASLQRQLLNARDSQNDVSAFSSEEMRRADVPSIVSANARRATESLRVLEELAKLPDAQLDPMTFKKARFAVYDIEREIFGRVTRRDKRIEGLYVIIDREALGNRDEVDICQQAISGGARVVQLRDKARPKARVLESAQRLSEVCVSAEIPFIMNDCADVAIAAKADGVHLGQGDLPIPAARCLLPIDMLIGCSIKTTEQALQAEADGADYLAVGSIYPTSSKVDTAVVGIDRLRRIREAVSLPIVAIGGITADNAGAAIDAGADAVAVIDAVLGADDVECAARRIAERLEAK